MFPLSPRAKEDLKAFVIIILALTIMNVFSLLALNILAGMG